MARKSTGKRVRTVDGQVRVAGKNANGLGSIYWDAKQACYRGTYVDPATGKRRTVAGRTKAIVEERRAAKLEELTTATPAGQLGPNPTVGTYATWWHENIVDVRAGTHHSYRKDIRRIADSDLGRTPLADLSSDDVHAWITALATSGNQKRPGEGLAARTRRNTLTRLRQILEHAVNTDRIPKNPARAVAIPKLQVGDRTAKVTLTSEQIRRLLAALSAERPYDAAIALLFTSGIRVSQALGLAWSDIDLTAGTATIRRGATYEGGDVGLVLDDPKTTETAGVHHLAPTAIALLRSHRARQAETRLAAGDRWETVTYEGVPLDLVFTTRTGGLVRRTHVDKAIKAACERAGLDATGVATHTGRRSVVTALFVDGATLEDIANHVGHTDTATTASYVQDLGPRPEATARRAAALLDPAGGDVS